MKQQLTLEHIAWYLPHGLFAKWNKSQPFEVKGLQKGNESVSNELWIWKDNDGYNTGYLYECSPILVPMSDLTKPFVKNGVETTHLQELAKMALQKVFRMLEEEDLTLENITIQDTDFGKMIRFEHHGSWYKFICESDYKAQRYGFYFIRDNDINYYLNQITLLSYIVKHKFDFQNLIGLGLAIDVNTLENNVYN